MRRHFLGRGGWPRTIEPLPYLRPPPPPASMRCTGIHAHLAPPVLTLSNPPRCVMQGHPVLEGINHRVSDLTRQPLDHQEHVQVLRYELTQRWDLNSLTVTIPLARNPGPQPEALA